METKGRGGCFVQEESSKNNKKREWLFGRVLPQKIRKKHYVLKESQNDARSLLDRDRTLPGQLLV